MFKTKKAFTLIELLVVIAIIGLLATLSVIALSNARAKSRDSKRLADIKQMQTSLALYYDQTDHYPTTDEFNSGTISYYSAGIGTTTYMKILPAAPVPNDGPCSASGNGYVYTPTDGGASYTLSFCIGGSSNNLAGGSKCATPGGILNIGCDGSGGNQGGGTCTPDCTSGKNCGDDGCGGSCGDCTFPETCGGGGTPGVCGEAIAACSAGTVGGTPCSYAGENYPTVTIGTQVWLAKNLNVGTMISGADNQTNNSTLEKYCYDDIEANCTSDGGLYQWAETIQYLNGATNDTNWSPTPTGNIQGICPTGWHIPSDSELPDNTTDWRILEQGLATNHSCDSEADHCSPAGDKLKKRYDNPDSDNYGCSPDGSDCGSSGFEGLLAGYRAPDGSFDDRGDYAHLWSSLPYPDDPLYAWERHLNSDSPEVYRNENSRALGFSVRCLQD